MLWVLQQQMALHVHVNPLASLLESLKMVPWFIRNDLFPFVSDSAASLNRWAFHLLTLGVILPAIKEDKAVANKANTGLLRVWAILSLCFVALLNLILRRSHPTATCRVPVFAAVLFSLRDY
jgi:hypothetical protein